MRSIKHLFTQKMRKLGFAPALDSHWMHPRQDRDQQHMLSNQQSVESWSRIWNLRANSPWEGEKNLGILMKELCRRLSPTNQGKIQETLYTIQIAQSRYAEDMDLDVGRLSFLLHLLTFAMTSAFSDESYSLIVWKKVDSCGHSLSTSIH